MAELDLADPDDYARFLRVQLAARRPVEVLLARILGENAPPPQASLILADLAALGDNGATPLIRVVMPSDADLAGACWAIAGSHLGNRAMLHQIAARTGDAWPVGFLGDAAMAGYWRELRPQLAREALPADPAIGAACAVFGAFLAAATAEGLIAPGRAAA